MIWPIHSTALPVTVMLPSSAYCSVSSTLHAIVVERPWREWTGAGTIVISDEPVP